MFPSNVHINILRGLPCRLESLRLKFTNEPSIFVDGDLDESIKRSASDRLGDLVPQVQARTSPGVFRDMALLGLCLELSFNALRGLGRVYLHGGHRMFFEWPLFVFFLRALARTFWTFPLTQNNDINQNSQSELRPPHLSELQHHNT